MLGHVRQWTWRLAVVALLVASCGSPPAAAPPRGRGAGARPGAQSVDQAVETLRPLAAAGAVRPVGRRDIFSFGGRSDGSPAAGGAGPGDRAGRLPQLSLPLPVPDIRLLGIAATNGRPPARTAVLSIDGELVLAGVGDQLGGRYTVAAIGDDFADLTDAVGGRTVRLAWQ